MVVVVWWCSCACWREQRDARPGILLSSLMIYNVTPLLAQERERVLHKTGERESRMFYSRRRRPALAFSICTARWLLHTEDWTRGTSLCAAYGIYTCVWLSLWSVCTTTMLSRAPGLPRGACPSVSMVLRPAVVVAASFTMKGGGGANAILLVCTYHGYFYFFFCFSFLFFWYSNI